jgi:tripartite-type tricarboxylate transporter receptor subunit TctC
MADLGQEVAGTTSEEFGAFLKTEIQKMREVVRASGATVN